MPLKLNKSPLVFVLAQVKTTPIRQISKYIDELQESYRRIGFPYFNEEKTHEIVFGPTPDVREKKRWMFHNESKQSAIVLSHDFFVYETNTYDVFEKFLEEFKEFLSIYAETVKPGISTRLGLRYVDVVNPSKTGRNDKNYFFQPGLHGIPPLNIDINNPVSRFEYRADTEEGLLIVRLSESNDKSFLPPDIRADLLDFSHLNHLPTPGDMFAMLDIDHSSPEEQPFVVDSILQKFTSLHEVTDKAFLSIVTDEALNDWERVNDAAVSE